jgi:hypothetical protein
MVQKPNFHITQLIPVFYTNKNLYVVLFYGTQNMNVKVVNFMIFKLCVLWIVKESKYILKQIT